jgi:hypothetical protein
MRLADAPVPRSRWWWLMLALSVIVSKRRSDRQAVKVAGKVGQELGESVVARWEKTDADTATMITLTQTMVHLTWAVVALTVVVIGATLYLGLR